MVYKSKKFIATFLAIFTTVFSICSSAVIVSADNAFWDYMIGGVEFLRELTGLTFDFSNSMLDTGFKLGEQLDKALKEGESNGLDYGGAYYNKESNMFYLKKDSDNNVYLNQNFYDVVYNTASSAVHNLDGYYYFEPKNPVVTACIPVIRSNYREIYKDNANALRYINSTKFMEDMKSYLNYHLRAFIPLLAYDGSIASKYVYFINRWYKGMDMYLYIDNNGYLMVHENKNLYHGNDKSVTLNYFTVRDSGTDVDYLEGPKSDVALDYIKASMSYAYGEPFKVFYSQKDLDNFLNNGRRYVPKIKIDNTIKIPKELLDNRKLSTVINNYYNDIDKSNKTETEIQDSFNNTITNYFNQFTDGEDKPATPTPTPTSKPGSGGDIGDGTTPTPTPPIIDGGDDSGNGKIDLKEITDLLKQILEKLTSFTESHTKFEKTITDYIEANDGKLDQIIEAINALSDGKTEDEKNGCKYDFAALSDFMTKLWNESDKKFDKMVELLEENNKYQKKLVNSLNEIKAILVTQTIMDVFQDRSQQTAEKAKDKFPTSLPWDIALVVNAMSAEPEKPQFNLPIQIKSLNINEEIHVDLASGEWEKLAKTCRYLLSILFILLMIQLSRKLFSNGGDD